MPRIDRSSGLVTGFGVEPALGRRLRESFETRLRWRTCAGNPPAARVLEENVLRSDALVFGTNLLEPVGLAQRVHRVDKSVPVLILTDSASDARLREKILFSNHLGSEVRPFPVARIDELAQVLQRAVERRQQRRHYSGAIESAQLNLGKLSLFQPEINLYLDRLLDRAPLGVVSVDSDSRILSLSRRAEDLFGAREARLLGRSVESLFAESGQALIRVLLRSAAKGTAPPGPNVLRLADDMARPTWVEATVAPLVCHASRRGAMLMLQDVSERVEAENERERAVADLRAHVGVLNVFHGISSSGQLSLDQKCRQMLELGCRQTGMPVGLVVRRIAGEFEVIDACAPQSGIAPGDRLPGCRSLLECTCDTETLICAHHSAKEGSRPARIGGNDIAAFLGIRVFVHGRVYGAVCFASPSTRTEPLGSTDLETLKLIAHWVGGALQREADEAQMSLLSGALEQAADSVVLTDARGRIEYVNPAFETASGYSKDEVLGSAAYTVRGERTSDGTVETLWRQVSEGGVFRGTVPGRRRDGSTALEETTVAPLRDVHGRITHFIATAHDITERTRAEDEARRHRTEMAHVARLSTLGEMTSGLAHELTQPLCAITTYAHTCMRILDSGRTDPDELRYGLEQVVRQADLGAAIFRRLRNFARKEEPPVRRAVALDDLIREAVSLVDADMRQQQVVLDLPERRDLQVNVDPIQIEQVFVNLLRNALDAVGDMSTDRRSITVRYRRVRGSTIKVTIADRGPGCPVECVAKLFQPFFTTKPKGLGIGLGISQTIIEAHGGRLQLTRNGPRGATFAFTLTETDPVPR